MRWAALAVVAYAGMAALAVWRGPWAEHLGPFLVLYAVAWLAAWGASRTPLRLGTVLLGALLFRTLLVPLTPSLSDDVYRYVWEGRVQNAGFDPFVLPPDAPQLASLRDDVWARVNHRGYAAIYPPLAQLAFRGLARCGGVTVFKSAFCTLDLVTIALLGAVLRRRRAPMGRLALYAWSPLAVVEIAASGHLEPLGVLPFVAALALVPRRPTWGWTAFACSLVAKYAALAALPTYARAAPPRLRALMATVAVVGGSYALYAGAGSHLFDSLRTYAEYWRYNDCLFSLLQRLVHDPRHARRIAAGLAGLACVAAALWNAPLERRARVALTAALALSPTVHPWYLLWPLALVPLAPSRPVLAWSLMIGLAYLFGSPAFGIGPLPKDNWTLKLVEILPVGVLALGPWLRRLATTASPRAFRRSI